MEPKSSDKKQNAEKYQEIEDEEEEYELDQEQIIQAILTLGNEIWHNFGQEGEIDDYSVFFQH